MANNGEREKQVSPQALSQSVIETPEATTVPVTPTGETLLWFVAQAADEIVRWGRNPKLRDRQLRDFYPTEAYFTSALGVIAARNTAFSYTLEGPDSLVKKMQEVLDNANQGEGWHDLVAATSVDLYTQDNGAFWEIVRAGDKPSSEFIGLNTLDSARCWHTGDPSKPVIYMDKDSKYHLLPWYNVVTLAELPVPTETFYGIQICVLSRLLRAAQVIKNITIYKEEKTGGRFQRAMHLVSGISSEEINDALQKVAAEADSKGLLKYIQPLVVGSVDPKAAIGHDTIELASLPDGFSEEDTLKSYITIMAMAFLADYQEFAPLPGGNLGTSSQSEILHMKGRGKGPALFQKIITHALNFKILPSAVTFKYTELDTAEEESKAKVKLIRAETRKFQIESQEITPEAARQLAVDVGDISPEVFEALGGADITPSITVHDESQKVYGKVSKDRANYRRAGEDGITCANCRFLIFGEEYFECEVVEGRIDPNFVSDLWQSSRGTGGKQQGEVEPARAGPFRGAESPAGSTPDGCCGEGSCCY